MPYLCNSCRLEHPTGYVCHGPKPHMVHIQIKHRQRHGFDMIDVCDPEQAVAIKTLTKKKTIDMKDIQALRLLGCHVEDLDETLKEIFA